MTERNHPKRMVVGISGASGAILGIELLKTMRQQLSAWETHRVISAGARRTIKLETSYLLEEVESLATSLTISASSSSASGKISIR
jgi:3-polyprenyl-4-hydroxybenzoate decarboxylase